jgi:hypothetical protein
VFWRVCRQDWGGAGRERKGRVKASCARVCVRVSVCVVCVRVRYGFLGSSISERRERSYGRGVSCVCFLLSLRQVRHTAKHSFTVR